MDSRKSNDNANVPDSWFARSVVEQSDFDLDLTPATLSDDDAFMRLVESVEESSKIASASLKTSRKSFVVGVVAAALALLTLLATLFGLCITMSGMSTNTPSSAATADETSR